jgi:membrane-associated protease RseP (regulator of RpoE activity)
MEPANHGTESIWLPDEDPGPPRPAPEAVLVDREGRVVRPAGVRRPHLAWPIGLFIATCLSTFWAGGGRVAILGTLAQIDPAIVQQYFVYGLEYAATVLAILFAHEMGHFLQSVRYGVPATLPMFIPMPFNPIGTFGAVIFQRGDMADRRALFDIAISGPLAGLVLAIPALVVGLQLSSIGRPAGDSLIFGEPLLVKWLIHLRFGTLLPGEDVILHPIAFAGWVGIFITGLNLLPMSQLDGGHVLYSLLLRRSRPIALSLWFAAVAAVLVDAVLGRGDLLMWLLMLGLIWMMGVQHPPTRNDHMELGMGRTVLGWVTLAFVIIGFTPYPITIPPDKPTRDKSHQGEYMQLEPHSQPGLKLAQAGPSEFAN